MRQALAWSLALWAVVAGGPGVAGGVRRAGAQLPLVPPRILVIFDTSGSMAWWVDNNEGCGGDGSDDFPVVGRCRLREAKQALRSVLLSVGESEAEFALMRFAQREGFRLNRFPEYYPLPINYEGTCEGGGDVLVPFGGGNLDELVSWIDQRERWPENRELRADGGTPLYGSLLEAHRWLRDEVLPGDEHANCRIYSVILLTDGVETCAGPGDDSCALIEDMRSIENGHEGGRTEVTTYVVGFGPADGRLEGNLDALAQCAGTDVNGRSFRAEDEHALQLAFGRIIGLSLPIEVCDDRDNDCDGLVDEGVRNRCGDCGPEPAETCNGIDDDCDREVDEGVRNSCGECAPEPVEVCNNQDDDCDGLVDEDDVCHGCIWRAETCDGADEDCDGVVDNDVTRPCGSSIGECRPGLLRCEGGHFIDACEGGVEPVEESCDGLDNDCDAVIDGHTRPCGEGVGECASGRQICVAGAWGDCLGAKSPRDEVCNNKDDDCDGETDEGVRNSCNECGPAPLEVCDGGDDDCDGRIDDGARCSEGQSCVQGECARPCFHGECALGQRCLDDVCLTDPCRVARCPPGTACDPATGECADPCAGTAEASAPGCDEGQVCRMGACVTPDCRDLGCDPGQICREGRCEEHPCRGVDCSAAQYCRDGACVPSCAGVQCPVGEQCAEGVCVVRSCVDAQCPRGQACVDGECAQDPCGGVSCPADAVCLRGQCMDPPCRFVVCPQGQFCEDGLCILPEPTGEEPAGAGEGEGEGPSEGEGEGEGEAPGPAGDGEGEGEGEGGSCLGCAAGAPAATTAWTRRGPAVWGLLPRR